MIPENKIIIDCDPGQDDAVGLLLALASPSEINLVGITTVAGNVPLDKTSLNARMICDLAGRTDIPVYAGCSKPIERELITCEKIHGETGINGLNVFDPITVLQKEHAVDYLVRTLKGADKDDYTLVLMGPATNLAKAIQEEPSIKSKIRQIVFMGGAMREAGNHTPSAEFNILVDPEAAEIILKSGRPLIQIGLDVTHQVLSTRDRVNSIKAIGNPVALATANMLSFFDINDTNKYDSLGAPLHDPCTIAWLIKPELFVSKRCNVSVETSSELTLGHTAVDFWHVTNRPRNVNWVYEIDAEGFYNLLIERLERFGGY